jgi:predicted DNA-binding protein with PD1-like motif
MSQVGTVIYVFSSRPSVHSAKPSSRILTGRTRLISPNRVDEQVEVASLTGNIALGPDGGPAIHVHSVLGRRDGTALAGHLKEGHVRPTLEIVLTESPAYLCNDPETGLALIRLEL